jgi:hypothetical protein
VKGGYVAIKGEYQVGGIKIDEYKIVAAIPTPEGKQRQHLTDKLLHELSPEVVADISDTMLAELEIAVTQTEG